MEFISFISRLEKAFEGALPGEAAQYRMAPRFRSSSNDLKKLVSDYRKSSVLLLLYPFMNTPHFILTKRTTYKGAHSGQISFPGGRHEPEDQTLDATALREAQEEIGVISRDVRILGSLTKLYIPGSRFVVHPFVGITSIRPAFVKEEKEVEKILETKLADLMDPSIIKTKKVAIHDGRHLDAPYYDIHGETLWGATAMIISEFCVLLQQSGLSADIIQDQFTGK